MTKAQKANKIAHLRDTLEWIPAAHGAIIGGGLPRLEKAIFDLLEEIENTFCDLDWRAYRDWAYEASKELGFRLEPCEAWFSVDGDPEWTPNQFPIASDVA